MIQKQYEILKTEFQLLNKPLSQNKNVGKNMDFLLRNLDCDVIESLHNDLKKNKDEPYDSVRGMFLEGKEIYETSGFREKTHIQICIRNPNCIKGYFSPLERDNNYTIP